MNTSPRARDHSRFEGSAPTIGNYPGGNFVVGGGVAIFHVASARVVLCYHTREKHYFLPKGRRDVNEPVEEGACREGFEESGYRNRLLPLPLKHKQPAPHHVSDPENLTNAIEPVWLQLAPITPTRQYILYWYIAETLPPSIEEDLNKVKEEEDKKGRSYQVPPKYPTDLKLRDRVALEPEGYEPPRHLNTGVDEDEVLYVASLYPIQQALEILKASIQADVIKKGWEAVQLRLSNEEQHLYGM